jgi:uncharacterized protein (UPF0371 family)
MRTLVILATLLAPVLASADPGKTAEQKHSDDCAAARKANRTCVLDMGKEELTGDKPIATGVSVGVITTGKEPSLIHLRRDFIVEIIKSSEDID